MVERDPQGFMQEAIMQEASEEAQAVSRLTNCVVVVLY
jgi:hypothetical protein